MKKKILVLMSIMIIILGLIGCERRQPIVIDNTYTVTEDETEEETEDETEDYAEDETEEDIEIPADYINYGNVYMYIDDNWKYYASQDDTYAYKNVNANETFAIYIENETMYSANDMYKSYENLIFSVFGNDYYLDSYDDGDYVWRVYRFDENNINDSSVCADIYLYSDGDTTIYIENAYEAGDFSTGDILDVINSIIIEE